MDVAPARLELIEGPADILVELPSGGTCQTLDPGRRLFVRLAGTPRPSDEPPAYEVRVCTYGEGGRHDPARLQLLHDLGWGGRRNLSLYFDVARGWVVEHAGHLLPFHVNGEPVRGSRPLTDGDRIEPARGLVLLFGLGSCRRDEGE